MLADRDHYEAYYADKLWALLPAVYRTLDSETLDRTGPLREMVNRLGAQAAIVRRNLDRLWDDQSIETCDDWVISYVADLLATNLVSSLDARGQRIDVAKTIYYRRRKGTPAILEEIAADITGWEARVVEFFRALSRTRHNFDPAIGLPADTNDPQGYRTLQRAQGLVGRLTQTPLGGYADLRQAYGATKAHSAFDEFFYTADLRQGRGLTGWYNIPRLGVFLWRLFSFEVKETTPVPVLNCPNQFSFDPTGRQVPLFARNARQPASFGNQWVSPQEWQMPTPINQMLLADQLAQVSRPLAPTDLDKLYPASLAVWHLQGSFFDLVDDVGLVTIDPELGRFKVANALSGDTLHVTYHYGFASTLGAGPYDRRVLRQPPLPQPAPLTVINGGGAALAAPLTSLPPTGTLSLGDSLTYPSVSDVSGLESVTIRAENHQRPVIRLAAPAPNVTEWSFTGVAGSELILDGLLISGGDVVLRGEFDRVQINCCTLDPGNAGETSGTFQPAVDGRDLIPTHLWIEGSVRELCIERCITGPIQTRAAGSVEQLQATDSFIQGLWSERALQLTNGDVDLSRCTVLGRAEVHRLSASECIFDDIVTVDDTQHGCIRFSAWSTGSIIPRQYESLEIAPQAPLFTARIFGQPGYGQLLLSADTAIVSGAEGATISEGAQNGSEMGAFSREQNPIKLRSLQIKYEEFMPLGLSPVFIPVT